jgi:hypothetical protein
MREQFPGIAKADNALDFIFDIVATVAWIYVFVLMLSGWHRLFNIRRRWMWSYESMIWAGTVFLLWGLSFVVGLILSTFVWTGEGAMNWLIYYPMILVWGVGIIGGSAMLVVSWIASLFVKQGD